MIVAYQGKQPRIATTAFIAPDATIIGDVEIGDYASIWFGARLRGDGGSIKIGARTNIQDNAVLHVDSQGQTVIGAGVTVGHGAVLHNCTVGQNALIGMNAVIQHHAVIGDQSIIAAGSVVTEGQIIPSGQLAAGVPAQIKKPLTRANLDMLEHAAAEYVALVESYRTHHLG
jgi:carbonic anhydrase/acetyltransferase-like protein (isoleucine patch superfamily)